MNITDVGHLTSDDDHGEDKMEKGAAREEENSMGDSGVLCRYFKNEVKMLNILPPAIYCKATDHIQEQIDMVKRIEENGYTYIIDDGVYFDTSKLKDYGKLARLDIEGLQAGRRVDVVKGKKILRTLPSGNFLRKIKKELWNGIVPGELVFPAGIWSAALCHSITWEKLLISIQEELII